MTLEPFATKNQIYLHLHEKYCHYNQQLFLIVFFGMMKEKSQLFIQSREHKLMKLLKKNMVLNDIDRILKKEEVSDQPLKDISNEIIENERKIRKEKKVNNKKLFLAYTDIEDEKKLKEVKYLIGDIIENKGNITIIILIDKEIPCSVAYKMNQLLNQNSIVNSHISWFTIQEHE